MKRATRPGRARGIGSGWLVSIGIHGALLFAASRVIQHAAAEREAAPEFVMTLDLRATNFAPRAEERVREASGDTRSVIPSAPAQEWSEPESAPRDLEDMLADDASASDAVIATAGGSRAPGIGATISASRLPKTTSPAAAASNAGGEAPRGAPSGPPSGGASAVFLPPEIAESPAIGYPAQGRRAHQEGEVKCRIHVSTAGLVDAVDVVRSSGFALLDEAARIGLTHWRFKPAHCGGAPCACIVDHVVVFRLTSATASAR